MAHSRREFIRMAGILALGGAAVPRSLRAGGSGEVVLPFGNGGRELVAYPEKRPLIRVTARPPQLETPFAVFNEGLLTPNDAFFVRYHLAGIPTSVDPSAYRLRVRGRVSKPLDLSLAELKGLADPVELIAVNQCSGNSRGFFTPRVGGGQLGNGAMGNARWTGIPLRAILDRAGVLPGARQVTFEGLDRPVLPATPEFVKALPLDHAGDGEVMVAYAMNGTEMPLLNGYPLRLVVPGYFGTYWVKHLSDVTVVDTVFDGYWMATAYRVPDTPDRSVPPGTVPARTVPIGKFAVRSFITSVADGDRVSPGRLATLRGIAFDSGAGIRLVEVSVDGGEWRPAGLSAEQGRYGFREWTFAFTPGGADSCALRCRATSRSGETQPLEAGWNPGGFMRNAVETVRIGIGGGSAHA